MTAAALPTIPRPLRVLWLAKGLGRGGAERLLVDTAAALDRDQVQVDVAYVMPVKDALVDDLRAQGVRVTCLGVDGDRGPRWVGRLRALVAAGEYDVVHTHMPVPAVAARLALRRPHPVLIHTEHNVWRRYRRATYWANALTYRRNAKVIAVSHAVADSISDRWLPDRAERLVVLHHGVVRPVRGTRGPGRAAARRRLGLDGDAFVVGVVASLTAKKGHDVLLDAFARVLDHVPTARLVIIGGGPKEAELRAIVAARGLTDVVSLLGVRDDVARLLPAFDVYASASWHEGLPIAVIEAMAAGVPVVVTDAGGTAEIVRDGVDGTLTRPGDPAGIAAAIEQLHDDRALRARRVRAGRARAADFDIAETADRLQTIYADVAGRDVGRLVEVAR